MTGASTGPGSDEAVVTTARMVVLGLAAGIIGAVLVTAFVRPDSSNAVLVVPAAILGIVSPVIGYRLYLMMRDKVSPGAEAAVRRGRFLQATLVSLAVTEGAALLGVIAFLLSGEVQALIGVVTHAILSGALWPTEEKLEAFAADGEAR